MRRVTEEALADIERVLAGANEIAVSGGEVRMVWAPLPGRTVVAAARVDGVLWITVDDEKPLGRRHAAELIVEAVATCEQDGVTRLLRVPTPRQPCHLNLVG